MQLATACLKYASREHSKTSAIINEEISSKLPPAAQGCLVKESSLRRQVQRERRRHMPGIPKTSSEIDLSGTWGETHIGEPWVICDFCEDDNRLIIFSTKQNLLYLSQSDSWYWDGTFDVSPPLFYQLYTIHATYLGKIVPLVFCLLPNKTEETYVKAFQGIKDKMREFDLFEDVSAFRVDCEKSVHNAASRVFPGVTIECCYFHFSQANWRKIVDLGLRSKYVHDIEFGMKARMFIAPAFLPSEHVHNAFAQLQSIPCSDEGLQNYMEYFERNFIGRYKSSIKNGKLSLKWNE